MQFLGLAAALAVLAILVLLVALRLLLGGRWFLAWLRGTLGLCLLIVGVIVSLVSYDISSYREHSDDEVALSQIRINQTAVGNFQVQHLMGAQTDSFFVHGSDWRVIAHMLDWQGFAAQLGLKPGYRLDSFLSADNEQQRLVASLLDIDFWRFARDQREHLTTVKPEQIESSAYPLSHGAEYRIVLRGGQIEAQPLNEIAILALQNEHDKKD